MIWIYQFTAFDENCPIALDDTPERRRARINLFKCAFLPVGNGLIHEFPNTLTWAYYLDDVIKQYMKIRDDAKRAMEGFRERGHLLVIDRHKISAAMLMATLDVEPLRIIGNQTPETEAEQLANEILAFKSAVRILVVFAKHASVSSADNTGGINVIFPPTQEGVNYQHHAYLALHHARKQGKERLNLPMLAHWMFYIEKYWLREEKLAPGQTP